ncbi:RNA-binding domain-containing protein [Wilcoxina mikolae CBS 423.85]|nr:RNA-binding domain-containing protein [Wilcoxina mikolae CBS 423.85]
MFALRRLAVTAGRSASRPAVPIASSNFGLTRYTRPQNLSELRSFESLLQQRWNSSWGENEGGEEKPTFGYRRLSDEQRREERPPVAPTRVVYVGNLKYEVTEKDLHDKFSEFGSIRGVRIPRTSQDGVARGFGYIEFETLTEAAEAIEAMHQAPFHGRRLNVQFVNRSDMRIKSNPESKTLFIGNLSFNTTDDDLNELFKEVPGCVDVRVAMDRRTGQPRGFVHADFTDVESAVAAKEKLTGTQLYGRSIRIDYSVPPEDRKKQWEQRQAQQMGNIEQEIRSNDSAFEAKNESTTGEVSTETAEKSL